MLAKLPCAILWKGKRRVRSIEKPDVRDKADEAKGVYRNEDPKLNFKGWFYRIWKNRLYRACGLILAALLAIPIGIALADVINPDGDTVASGNQTTVNLGYTNTPGQPITPAPRASFQLQCTGNTHVQPGQTISLTYSSAGSTIPSGGSLSATNTSIGPVPNPWPPGGGCGGAVLDDNGDSTVTITPPSQDGSYTFVVTI
jgi:hypothetical protein